MPLPIFGLNTGTADRCRLIASNASGKTLGADKTLAMVAFVSLAGYADGSDGCPERQLAERVGTINIWAPAVQCFRSVPQGAVYKYWPIGSQVNAHFTVVTGV